MSSRSRTRFRSASLFALVVLSLSLLAFAGAAHAADSTLRTEDIAYENAQRAASANYYPAAAALVKLLGAVRKKAEADKVLYPAGTAPATVGFVNDIVRAMVELHRKARRELAKGDVVALYAELESKTEAAPRATGSAGRRRAPWASARRRSR